MADVTSTFAAKDVGFTSTVNRMQKTLAGFQSNLGGFATKLAGLAAAFVGVQQSVAAFNSALAMGGRLDDLNKTTGASAGELALLEKAFQLAGSSAEAVGPAIARLNRFMVEASNGAKTQTETMDKLGLSYSQLAGLTPTEQMRLLAKSIMALPTPAERTAAAMDIFGRSGSTLIPLFANFSGELDKAQGYLGSLPGLLDQSAGAMADMEDDLGALGDKFNQFVAGLVAGAAGADNFASALAKIDTAGIGANLGEQLRVAFDAPLSTAKAIGYTLLTGAKEAGNSLINGFNTAGKFLINLLSDGQYWQAVGDRIKAALMEAVNGFNKLLLTGVEEGLLKPLSNLPGIVGEPFRAALQQVQEIRKGLEATSAKNYEDWTKSGENLWKAVARAAESTEVIEKDWLGVQQSAEDAARHMMEAQEQSRQIREDSAETAANYAEGSAAIRNALADIRGFDLKGQMGPEARPDWMKSNQPPPTGERIAREEEAARARNAGRGGITEPDRPLTQDQRVAQMRAQAAADRTMGRAGEFQSGSMFRSAVRRQQASERAAARVMESQQLRDMAAQFDFGGRAAGNFGEALMGIVKEIGKLPGPQGLNERIEGAEGFDPTKSFDENARNAMRQGAFDDLRDWTRDAEGKMKRMADEQAKTPDQRKREEEEARDRSKSPGGGADGQQGILQNIQSTLAEFKTSMEERLPQQAMI